MQVLKNIVINAAMVLVMLFGLMVSATAETDFERDKTLAEKGGSFDQDYLGDHYSLGRGVRQDYSKAFYWYQKAADQGYSNAQYSIGDAYFNGKGVRQDYSKALEWLKKSAKQNNKFAQAYIGTMYEDGIGVRQNKTTAKEWYGKSCDNGEQIGCNNYKRMNEQGY